MEQYQIDLVAAAQHSRKIMDQKLYQLCAAQVPGDTYRDLQVQADYSRQTFKHVLLPVWMLTYNYGAKVFQVVVNGYTGEIAGEHPLSWVKVTILILVIALAVLIIVLVSGNGSK